MKKVFTRAFFAFLLTGCASTSSYMTMHKFEELPIGTPLPKVLSSAGKPTTMRRTEEGLLEYEYVERISNANRLIEERHYYIVLNKKGKIVSKRLVRINEPPYLENSYEMQTSQSDLP